MKNLNHSKKGFTLIELLVVIGVIAITIVMSNKFFKKI
ncbi:MAG: type II secretion system protein [Candidatus Hodarchaeota archaeon]